MNSQYCCQFSVSMYYLKADDAGQFEDWVAMLIKC